jgi:hypothetical protein
MRCASSLILTGINTLRNPEGRERNWSCPIVYVSIFNRHGLKTAKLREIQLVKAVIGQAASLSIYSMDLELRIYNMKFFRKKTL